MIAIAKPLGYFHSRRISPGNIRQYRVRNRSGSFQPKAGSSRQNTCGPPPDENLVETWLQGLVLASCPARYRRSAWSIAAGATFGRGWSAVWPPSACFSLRVIILTGRGLFSVEAPPAHGTQGAKESDGARPVNHLDLVSRQS